MSCHPKAAILSAMKDLVDLALCRLHWLHGDRITGSLRHRRNWSQSRCDDFFSARLTRRLRITEDQSVS